MAPARAVARPHPAGHPGAGCPLGQIAAAGGVGPLPGPVRRAPGRQAGDSRAGFHFHGTYRGHRRGRNRPLHALVHAALPAASRAGGNKGRAGQAARDHFRQAAHPAQSLVRGVDGPADWHEPADAGAGRRSDGVLQAVAGRRRAIRSSAFSGLLVLPEALHGAAVAHILAQPKVPLPALELAAAWAWP